jgi:Pyruvate/2-oxoglutarate dehydrogenase complex, dihydrolipoamide dehydrogenase (E3) component, and related enzymes
MCVMIFCEVLVVKILSKFIVIIGVGAIGVEFAYFFNTFGTKITLIEILPQILPVKNEEITKTLEHNFAKQNITIHTTTKNKNIHIDEKTMKLDLMKNNTKTELEIKTVLITINIISTIDNLFSTKMKIKTCFGLL